MQQLHLWLKFYPKDWNGDHNLRACSLAARGLLAAFLEPMHEAEPYGHLLVRGKKPDYSDLAIIASCTLREVKYGIEELLKNHVLSTNDDGIHYSRRMCRDDERRKKQALGGKRGMETRLSNQQLAGGNLPVVLQSTLPSLVPPIEARSQKLEKNKNRTATDKAPSPVRPFLDWFIAEYATRRNGAKYAINWGAHGKLVKDLLAVHGPDRLRKHAVILLRSNEPWIDTTDRGIGVLSAKINWLEERLCAWEAEKRGREAV